MTSKILQPPSARHGTLLALRERDFVFFLGSRFCSGAAMTLLRATFAWQVFAITGSAFHLGLIGLAQFVPTFLLSLMAGAVADSYDRRRIMIAAQTATLLGSVALCLTTQQGHMSLPLLYGVIVAVAAAFAFEGPARIAMLPALVPRSLFPSAVVVQSTIINLSWATGPLMMGVVIHAAGVAYAYALHAALMLLSLALLTRVRSRDTEGKPRDVSLRAIREGLAFVWGREAVLGAMTLDMFAVIFGSATALLPVYATDILHVGPRGYGLLSSALEIGTLSMSVVLLVLPTIERPGRALLYAVVVYGLATVLFGFSRSFPLSMAAFIIAGMADQISMVTRSMIIQLARPDALRGRVSSVSLIFIGASNQLGAVESGFVAALTSATFSVVSGGLGCLVVLAVVAVKLPGLRRYRTGEH